MSTFEDYAVHREALADVLADFADVKVPYVTDNPDVPVPFDLTPAAHAELDTWTGPAPDPAEIDAARDAWNLPAMDVEPEFPAPDPRETAPAVESDWATPGSEPGPGSTWVEYAAECAREAEAG